ncbi:MAG: D-sedoheptulose 7-phosphate isomerase [FCB group bacterium]|jgi:D-sedoheptulose 7-phosphate isomerase
MQDYKIKIKDAIQDSIKVKQNLVENYIDDIESIGKKLSEIFQNSGKILLCGNGGSAADCQHIAAELVIRLRSNVNRAALPAIALTVDTSILTAGGNDIGFENVYARQVEAYGKKGDALIAISTSGNSENVYNALLQAKKQEMLSIGLLGCNGGKIKTVCDKSIIVPSKVTARIQESHILIAHIWCEMVEEFLFPEFFEK